MEKKPLNLDTPSPLEHLSNTGKVLYKEGTAEYERWREETKWELLASGFEKIEKRLDEWDLTLSDNREREAVRKLRNDLSGHSERLGEGRVIGSGQVEGACKSMIGLCYWGWGLKQSGARWKGDRLNERAVLCAVHYSDLWEKYWMQAK